MFIMPRKESLTKEQLQAFLKIVYSISIKLFNLLNPNLKVIIIY